MKILERLDGGNSRIVSFEVSKDKKTIAISEECDAYFSDILTKAEFGQMIAELQELHGKMID